MFFIPPGGSEIYNITQKCDFYPISLHVTHFPLISTPCQVNIQPSEWHRSLLLPQAWRGFMSRAYHAVLQVCMCLCIYIYQMTLLRLNLFRVQFPKHSPKKKAIVTSKKQTQLKAEYASTYQLITAQCHQEEECIQCTSADMKGFRSK